MSLSITLTCDHDDGAAGADSAICPVVFTATPLMIGAAPLTVPGFDGPSADAIDIARALADAHGWIYYTDWGGRDFCPQHDPERANR